MSISEHLKHKCLMFYMREDTSIYKDSTSETKLLKSMVKLGPGFGVTLQWRSWHTIQMVLLTVIKLLILIWRKLFSCRFAIKAHGLFTMAKKMRFHFIMIITAFNKHNRVATTDTFKIVEIFVWKDNFHISRSTFFLKS